MKFIMTLNLLAFILMAAVAALAGWMDVDPENFPLLPPPRENSRAWKKDFEELHAWEERRTREQCREASQMVRPGFDALFGEEGGLSEGELAALRPLMSKAFRMGEKVSGKYKEEYQRPRPYDVDASLRPCVKKPGGNMAYPSFHALAGQLGGCLLAKIFPDRRTFFLDRGKYIGDLRVIAGVHHPTDVVAGQDLGQRLCQQLLRDPEFLQELKEAL